ncbi:hypothetical protein NDN08_000297 [Rhodosorus marinus]|uniref:Uncharacterized protein n=1 Tax=Rhodosorus marinus TaxID=101924 RepID=A0AAV8UQA2_9RHOD|nr:hypothetical protein NDN08_000297 [Rhodosorus marinus]
MAPAYEGDQRSRFGPVAGTCAHNFFCPSVLVCRELLITLQAKRSSTRQSVCCGSDLDRKPALRPKLLGERGFKAHRVSGWCET